MRATTSLVASLAALALVAPAARSADERALDALIDRCVAAGGLGRSAVAGRLDALDPARIRRAVDASRPGLPPDQRVALIGRCLEARGSSPGLVALLRAVADASGDDLTRGWAAFWEGDLHRRRHEAPEAIAAFEAAAARFAAIGSVADRGNCYSAIAGIYSQQGDSRSALAFERKALATFRPSGGETTIQAAASLQSIGFLHANLGEKEEALASMRAALAAFEALGGPRGADAVRAQSYIGQIHFTFRDHDRAAEALARALTLTEEVHGRRSGEYAEALEALAAVDQARGSYPRAIRAYLDALATRRSVDGARSPGVAATLLQLARARRLAGDEGAAAADLVAALGIVREVRGARTAAAAEVLKELSQVHDDLGDHLLALGELREALEIERALYGERHIGLALTHIRIARAYQRFGDLGMALDGFRSALAIVEAMPGQEGSVIAVLGMISTAHLDLGQPDRAVAAMERALAVARGARGTSDVEVSRVLTQLGSTLMEGRDYAGAIRRLDEALAIQRDLPGGGGVDRAKTLIRVGRVRQLEGRLDDAEAAFREARDILRPVSGAAAGETMLATGALARVAFDRGRYAEAAEAYREVVEAPGRDRGAGLADQLKMLGAALARSGQAARASDAFDRAVDALRVDAAGSPAPGPPGSADALLPTEVTVRVLQARGTELAPPPGDPDEAARLARSLGSLRLAAEVLDRLRERLVVSGESKVLAGERYPDLIPATLGLCARLARLEGGEARLVEAFGVSERGAARAFLEALGRARSEGLGGVTPGFLAEEAGLSAEAARLDREVDREQARPIAARDSKRVAALLADRAGVRDRLGRAIERAERDFPAYAALKYPRPCTIEAARATLADDEVGLLYTPGDDRSHLIVVEKRPGPGSSGLAIHEVPRRSELSRMVAALRLERTLEDPEAALEQSDEASRALLGPAAAAIRGKALVIVPGGILGNLPFEVLGEPGGDGVGRRHLVQGHRIRYAPSLTALDVIGRWERARPRPPKGLWALGDPIYGPSDGRLAAAGGGAARSPAPGGPAAEFERLAGSGLEVERVAATMGAGPEDQLLGASATEAAVKRLASEGELAAHRYLHFASHGILGGADGPQPGLVLSLPVGPGGEDGVLRLDELAGLRLNADLVVLSACRSGQGREYRMEGVSGLARAFLSAGSRGVVCSLWRVDDAATADLMADLYSGLKAGLPAADALRSAQLKMIEAGEPPLHWAPFVLIGK